MKPAVMTAVVTSAAVIAMVSFVSLTSSAAAAQAGREAGAPKAAPAPPVPRMPDGHPDLTGVWWPGRDINPQTSTAYYAPPRAGAPAEPPSFSSLYQPALRGWRSYELREKRGPVGDAIYQDAFVGGMRAFADST